MPCLPPHANWPQMLQTLTFAYNCTAHESTGYAPFYLMNGRIPRLPVDVMFHSVSRDQDITDHDTYIRRLRADLKEALAAAQINTKASQQHQTELYNRRTKGRDIEEGDFVLLANKGEHGQKKLAGRWDSTPYLVVFKDPKCQTYRVRNTSTGQEKVVYRNLMLQASFLPVEEGQHEHLYFEDSESSSIHENLGSRHAI